MKMRMRYLSRVCGLGKANQLSRYPDFKYSRAIIENNILVRKKHV